MESLISEPFYSVLFIGGGLIFLFLEIFIPSGGILGLLSIASAGFGIFGLFYQGEVLMGFAAIVGTVTAAVLGIRFGLQRLSFAGSLPPETATSVDARIESLLGKDGVTYTPLRPAGVAIIDGRKVDVVTLGQFIDQNVPVRVIDNSGNRVVVKAISPDGGGA
jgi:membrane-bound serine protease (ClpP class)